MRKVSRFKLVLIFIAAAALLAGGVWYWQSNSIVKELVSLITPGSAVNKIGFQPSFPSSFADWDGYGITVVSTGKVFSRKIKYDATGEIIADSHILETLSKGGGGKVEKIYFVVQITLISNPQRNINSWIVRRAAELGSQTLAEDKPLTLEEMQNLFPPGSRWILVPLMDPGSEEAREAIPEYIYYAQAHYGEDLPELRKYVESSLLGNFRKPLFLLDIFAKL